MGKIVLLFASLALLMGCQHAELKEATKEDLVGFWRQVNSKSELIDGYNFFPDGSFIFSSKNYHQLMLGFSGQWTLLSNGLLVQIDTLYQFEVPIDEKHIWGQRDILFANSWIKIAETKAINPTRPELEMGVVYHAADNPRVSVQEKMRFIKNNKGSLPEEGLSNRIRLILQAKRM